MGVRREWREDYGRGRIKEMRRRGCDLTALPCIAPGALLLVHSVYLALMTLYSKNYCFGSEIILRFKGRDVKDIVQERRSHSCCDSG